MNILISGIHGFVGSNLVAALKAQHTIYGLDIVSPQNEGVTKTYSWQELEQIPAIDVVIHLAGKAHDTKNQTDAQVYFNINTGLTQQIYDWFLTTNASKFIFFSSVKAAADQVFGEILTEDVAPAPKGPYGESKIAAEQYLMARQPDKLLQTRHCEDDEGGQSNPQLRTPNSEIRTVFILRPCMIHDPGNKGNLNLLYKLVSKGIPWPLGAFENRRSFASIENLQFVIQQLIEKDIEAGTYQVADDEPLSTNQLIELIAESKGKKTRIWKVNPKFISMVARFGDKIHLPLNSERLKKLTEYTSYQTTN
jgi:nucleoside-diphosphate-sugar epimerase